MKGTTRMCVFRWRKKTRGNKERSRFPSAYRWTKGGRTTLTQFAALVVKVIAILTDAKTVHLLIAFFSRIGHRSIHSRRVANQMNFTPVLSSSAYFLFCNVLNAILVFSCTVISKGLFSFSNSFLFKQVWSDQRTSLMVFIFHVLDFLESGTARSIRDG